MQNNNNNNSDDPDGESVCMFLAAVWKERKRGGLFLSLVIKQQIYGSTCFYLVFLQNPEEVSDFGNNNNNNNKSKITGHC